MMDLIKSGKMFTHVQLENKKKVITFWMRETMETCEW